MSAGDAIRNLSRRIELLAPAGRPDVFDAVVAAGADAVYLGVKRFHMRRHRSDFHFTEAQLADALDRAHRQRVRVYVTVNAIVGESELAGVRDLLRELAAMGVDAIIVSDLGVIHAARELDLPTPMHASTMMNVHHPAQAAALRTLGVRRIIASRDVDLATIDEIGRGADVEVECFAHGDMCVAQSGQCSLSGLVFGKSANRGECMKPCRWSYDLVRVDEHGETEPIAQGHLLAIKDVCLLGRLPDVIDAGICSLKIEGRMRDAAYLGEIVAAYRQALDAYYAEPLTYRVPPEAVERVQRSQVRRLSSLTLTGGPSCRDLFDPTGEREPIFLSDGGVEPAMVAQRASLPANGHIRRAGPGRIELAVCVADAEAARVAIDAGADRVDIAAEVDRRCDAAWTLDGARDTIAAAHARGRSVGVRTPRVTTGAQWRQTRWWLERLGPLGVDVVLAHHPGTLTLARDTCPAAVVVADTGFNALNSESLRVLADMGAMRAAVSGEAGLDDIEALASASPIPLELLAHGPQIGMVLEHCLLALYVSATGRKDVCRGPCRYGRFALRDREGQVRPIVADQHCRNYVLTTLDVGILPELPRFVLPAVASLRIEGPWYDAALVGRLTRAYRVALDRIAAFGETCGADADTWRQLVQESPRPLNLGPYARSIARSQPTAQVMRTLAHAGGRDSR